MLPLGAAVGSAGLPTMPYDLTFTGDFFDIADFMAGLDAMVKVDGKGIGVDGRLLTIDGFSLQRRRRRLPGAQGHPARDQLRRAGRPGADRGRDPRRPGRDHAHDHPDRDRAAAGDELGADPMNMPDVKRFFTDLYRDLDDRHLLLPALALVVAIIAVPMLLGGGSSPSRRCPRPSRSAGGAADATAVESAVLAEDPGIRDYSQRLEALKKKNPFVQQFAGSDEAATDPAAELSAGSPTAETAALTDPTGTGTTGTRDETTEPVTDADDGPAATTPTTPTDPTQPVSEPELRFFAPRVDVTFGELGDTKQIDNVRYFDFLPDEETPVAAFLGLGESADKAVFALSNEVVDSTGEGSCSPHNADGCDLLIMRVGQERTMKLVDGTTYRLKVLDTHFTRIPDPRSDDETSTDGGGSQGAKPVVTGHYQP